MTVVGLLMGGWSSFNKYSLLGGLRSAAQIVSYEIPLTLSVVGLVILAGTMSLNTIVLQQAGSGWFTDWYAFRQPLGFLIFAIAATAEANRTPFDLTEADSEIVAGFATEYSGMRFGFFFFAEYIGVFIISALTVVLFLGGWNAPFPVPHISWDDRPRLARDRAAVPRRDRAGRRDAPLRGAVLPVPQQDPLVGRADPRLRRCSTSSSAGCSGCGRTSTSTGSPGLFWFLGKTFGLVFLFVWMRGTLPRVRIDQLMGFAWKWLLPASLLNLFVTALAILVIDALEGGA